MIFFPLFHLLLEQENCVLSEMAAGNGLSISYVFDLIYFLVCAIIIINNFSSNYFYRLVGLLDNEFKIDKCNLLSKSNFAIIFESLTGKAN